MVDPLGMDVVFELVGNRLLKESFVVLRGYGSTDIRMTPVVHELVRFVSVVSGVSNIFQNNQLYKQLYSLYKLRPKVDGALFIEDKIYTEDATILLDYLIRSYPNIVLHFDRYLHCIRSDTLKYLAEHEDEKIRREFRDALIKNDGIDHSGLCDLFASLTSESEIIEIFDYIMSRQLQSPNTVIRILLTIDSIDSDLIIKLIIKYDVKYTVAFGKTIVFLMEDFDIDRIDVVRYFVSREPEIIVSLFKFGFAKVFDRKIVKEIARKCNVVPIRDLTGKYQYIPKQSLKKLIIH
jgi:hypothetical protein